MAHSDGETVPVRRFGCVDTVHLEAVLTGANMDLNNIARLGVYTADVDEALKNFDLMGMRFSPKKSVPNMTLLGVQRL